MDEKTVVVEEEFTFKKFFELLKRSLKRMLIYALIAAVIGAALGVIFGVSKIDKKTYKTTIEYTHKGIDKGLAPDGTVLDYNAVKSPVVINTALKAMGYSDDAVASLSSAVEDALVVTPYISPSIAAKQEADPTYEYISTRYTVSIANKSVGGIKSGSYAALLNSIIEQYCEYFKSSYKYGVEAIDVIGSDAQAVTADYYDLIQLYKAQLKSMNATLNAMPDDYSTLNAKLTARISLLENKIVSLENYILINNVQKNNATLLLKENLDNRISEYSTTSDFYKNQIDELGEMISNYKQLIESMVVGNNDITVAAVDASVYNGLVSKTASLISLKAQCDAEKAVLEKKATLLPVSPVTFGTDEDRALVEKEFNALYSDYSAVVEYVNDEISSYTDLYILKSGVRVVNKASSVTTIAWLGVFAIFALCVFIGIVVAVIVTSVKQKKKSPSVRE